MSMITSSHAAEGAYYRRDADSHTLLKISRRVALSFPRGSAWAKARVIDHSSRDYPYRTPWGPVWREDEVGA